MNCDAGVFETMLMRTGFTVSIVHTLNEARRAMTAVRLAEDLKNPDSEISKSLANGEYSAAAR